MYGEDSFLYEGFRPDLRQQLVLRDQLARMPCQCDEDVKGFRGQSDGSAAVEQSAFADVECEIAEADDLAASHRISANLSKTFGTAPRARGYREFLAKGELL